MAQITNSKFIGDGVIVDADINASANITRSKLASGSGNHVVVNDGSGVLTSEAQLAISRGGTGQSTATAAFDALSPTTSKGDLIVRDATTNVRKAVGSNGTFLKADSADSTGIVWASLTSTIGYRSVTTTDTVTTSDDNMILSGTNFTSTLPSAVGIVGKTFKFVHNGTSLTNNYTIASTGGESIVGFDSTSTSFVLYTKGEVLVIQSTGSAWQVVDRKTETNWVSFTPTFQGLGTVTNIQFRWKRAGNSMLISGRARTGTPTATEVQISLPGSSIVSTLLTSREGVGIFVRNSSGAAAGEKGGQVLATSGDDFLNVGPRETFSSTNSNWNQDVNGSANFTNNDDFTINTVEVPISGWRA
jgi:hypothetical protein